MTELKRELGLGYATLFGVGLILGAGIYVLVGRAAGLVGDAVWISVAFSGLIALSTAFSYAELASMFPTAASTHTYIEKAFPDLRILAFISAWLIFFGGVAGAATAGLGFAGYFLSVTGMSSTNMVPVTIILLVFLTFLNWWGIKESAALSAVFTLIEASGLLLVAALGFLFPVRSPNYLSFNPSVNPILAVMVGASIFYFAYTGFEYQPTLSEETKNPEKIVPKAIVLAITVTTVVYLLVTLAVVRLMAWDELARSKAPLAEAAARVWPPVYSLLSAIALFATTNTVLGFLVSASRLVYGLSKEGVIASSFGNVDKWRRTPGIAVIFTGALSIFLVLFTDYLPQVTGWRLSFGGFQYELIDLVGKTASLSVLIAFILVNMSVIALRLRNPDKRRYFKIPLSIRGLPVLPLLADILIVFFIAVSFNDWIVWLSTILISVLGLLFYRKQT
ncbi:MAG: APC family permease [Infirmifilum sp.]